MMPKHSETPHKKKKTWLKVVFVVVATPLAVGFIYLLYLYYNPQLRLNFQQFNPTYLPNNLAVKDKNIEVWTAHPLLWFAPYSVSINLRLTNEFSYISESKNDKKTTFDYMCSPSTVNTKCSDNQTPKGQKYHQTLVYDSNDSTIFSSEEIEFVKEGTFIWINLDSPNNQPIPDTDIQTMIDSFQPTTFTNLTVKRYHPGP